jgi:hypothetical protein
MGGGRNISKGKSLEINAVNSQPTFCMSRDGFLNAAFLRKSAHSENACSNHFQGNISGCHQHIRKYSLHTTFKMDILPNYSMSNTSP